MTDQIVRLGPEYFPMPTSGIPVSGGSIYIGDPDTDPEIVGNQITVNALQENGSTVPISQPILTGGGGVPLYNGSPVTLLVTESYSLKVLDAFDVQIYYVPSTDVTDVVTAATVEYVVDLIGLINVASPADDDTYTVLSFFDGLNKGGGAFYWDSTVDKSTANGGTIIDPDNIGGFDGTTGTLTAYLSAQGAGVGFGCWIRLYEGAVNVTWFGADPVVTDNQPPFQSAVDSLPASIYVPEGLYITASPITIDHPMWLIGELTKRASTGGAKIDNTGTSDCIIFSSSQVLYDCGIRDIALASTAGNALNIPYGAARCCFTNLNLYTRDTTGSCVSGSYTGSDIGLYSCDFSGGEWIVDNVARTASIVTLFADANLINENTFRNIWLTQSNSRHAIALKILATGTWLYNNTFEQLNFENCTGGGIFLQGTRGTRLADIAMWDATAGYDDNIIGISDDETVYRNEALSIDGYIRAGDTLNGAAKDIYLGYSGSNIISGYAPTSGAAIIDFNDRETVIIGATVGTLSNTAVLTKVGGAEVESTLFTADTFETSGGAKLTDSGSDASLESATANVRTSSIVAANTAGTVLSGDIFYGGNGALFPQNDNLINLGHTTNRWKTVYAGTGTINTSDARSKTDTELLNERERAVAIKLKGAIRKFKFKDAVALKGDSARIHIGIMAQEVKAIFESEGLVAEKYGMLCHDAWDKSLNEDGSVIREAGDLYGIRYEELLAFIISAM